ncbi:uncharacterized protein CELE_F55H12.2 [Caenorhabditis elegans]|uniref:Uncharacterized protein n=1 Tax=Caenorhabditis elegans TaxID=6239 RepID=Q9XVM4_CAEEL|nr:Uncharacterized protein CELE_F55H12.2 [Caenorhabditis elegans]CAB03141.3 Uncharacterized protein CELE_F55H12.2 [Caenorhabditis elegans]
MSGKLEIISLEEFDEPFEEILKAEAEEAEKQWTGNSFDSWETDSANYSAISIISIELRALNSNQSHSFNF